MAFRSLCLSNQKTQRRSKLFERQELIKWKMLRLYSTTPRLKMR
jgi:hypothetical protein